MLLIASEAIRSRNPDNGVMRRQFRNHATHLSENLILQRRIGYTNPL
ncbi:hypothetical protein [Mycolicibacterium grossiae]|nr:hypothetical protein [Mycolicibacterium grossiae]